MNSKSALITGVGGQDGFFLSKLLLSKGYKVYGLSDFPLTVIYPTDSDVWDKIHFSQGNITDSKLVNSLVQKIQPDELYHLAAQSNVGKSFIAVDETMHINIRGTQTILEAVKNYSKTTKIYFAGSSEMFGDAPTSPQNEKTLFNPRSPYGESKVAAHELGNTYNKEYELFFATGITYNHESERRSPAFVTMKICQGLIDIKNGKKDLLELGNLNSIRDWGFAGDYVNAMWLMLQLEKPETYVISSGIGHSVEDFVNFCTDILQLKLYWKGEEQNRKAYSTQTNKLVIQVNCDYYREAEKVPLIGDSKKIIQDLSWEREYTLKETINCILSAII